MHIVRTIGNDTVATVYVAETPKGLIEFAESVQPPLPREEKWVIILSCLVGCPVGCPMCDAGRSMGGALSTEEMFAQIDYIVRRRYPDFRVPARKFKIQFTRMGEPTFNRAVLTVLDALPQRYDAPGLLPCISTIAPRGCKRFLSELKAMKDRLYHSGRFQLQFSLHTTDQKWRDRLIPVSKLSFEELAEEGRKFHVAGDRKITLNIARIHEVPVDPDVIATHFSPDIFLVKLTPLNPTNNARRNGLRTALLPDHLSHSESELVESLQRHGFDAIVSIGDQEENRIGSNCGQFVSVEARHRELQSIPLSLKR